MAGPAPSIFTAAAPPCWISRPALRIVSRGIELVGEKGHVGHHERTARAAADGRGVMNHRVESNRNRGLVTQDRHAERVADQEHVDARAVQQTRHGGVIDGEHGDLFAALLFPAEVGYADLLFGWRHGRH